MREDDRKPSPSSVRQGPKAIQIPTLEPGSSITRKLKIKVKRTAKKGKELAVKVTASSGTIKQTATRTVRVRWSFIEMAEVANYRPFQPSRSH